MGGGVGGGERGETRWDEMRWRWGAKVIVQVVEVMASPTAGVVIRKAVAVPTCAVCSSGALEYTPSVKKRPEYIRLSPPSQTGK